MKTDEITLIVTPLEEEFGGPQLSKGLIGTRKYPSLGLGYIAAVLEEAGYSIDFIDMYLEDMTIKSLLSKLRRSNPTIVGISCDVVTFPTAKKVAAAIKHEFPESYLITGGPHTPIYPEEVLINSPFDASVRGEGDHTIVELVEALEKNQPLKTIKGLSFKEKGRININEDRPPIKKLDEIPFPARHLMQLHKYFSVIAKKGTFTTLISSRGCPYRCTYCLEQGPYRLRDPKCVVDELELIVNKYNITEVFFQDSTFTANMKHAEKICKEIINRRLDVKWECKTRVDRVSKNLLKLMKYSGCVRVHYGIESGNPRILKVLNKEFSLKQAIDAVDWAKEANIEILAYFMIGAPEENLGTISNTINFAKQLDPDFALFSITSAAPGIPIYENALRDGFFKLDYWKEYILGNIKTLPKLTFDTDEYNRDGLMKLMRRAFFKFYFRPRYILKRLRNLQSIQELSNNFSGFLKLFKSFFEKF
jgi:radical SAM superfamily enzyme YgiQ (UPF0313 family)